MTMDPILIIYGIAGLILGFFISSLAHRIMRWKCEKQNKVIRDSPLDKRWFQIVVCIFNGALWALAALELPPVSALLCSALFTLAILFTIIDIRLHMIPNELLIGTLVLGILFQLIHFGVKSLLLSVACMLGMMLIFLLAGFILGMDKVGAGDVKLAGVMGVVLGYPAIVTAVFFMSIFMIAYCVIGIWVRKLTLVSMFPFAPFMMLGMMVSLGNLLFH